MRFCGDVFFDLAIFVNELDSAICKSNGQDVAHTLAERYPVMVYGVVFKF